MMKFKEWIDSNAPAACEIRYQLGRYFESITEEDRKRLNDLLMLTYNAGKREGGKEVIERLSGLVLYP